MEVNGFIIQKNDRVDKNANRKDYLVIHPAYEGFFMVQDFATLAEARTWCEKQDFNKWTKELSKVTIW